MNNRIRQLRKARHITMKELGLVVGLAESTISQYETGKRQPDNETLLKLSEYFNVTVGYLLGAEDCSSFPADVQEHDILDDVDVAFYGDYRELTEDDKETLRTMARIMRDRHNKKNKE